MQIETVKFQGHRCFKDGYSGFEVIRAVNVIIGRNNTGKSHLLDLAEVLCSGNLFRQAKEAGWKFQCRGVLDEASLRTLFKADSLTTKHGLRDSMWNLIGRFLVGSKLGWEIDSAGNIVRPVLESVTQQIGDQIFRGYEGTDLTLVTQIAYAANTGLAGKILRRLAAERDIRPESASQTRSLSPDGTGATNIIRRYLHSTSPTLFPGLIQKTLLTALNKIFGRDGIFTEIQAKHHDDSSSGHPVDSWEVFLVEEKKGPIALSRSGSGLKTVILMLLNLLVIPEIEKKQAADYAFAFEELENNLHPALLRRLFKYIEYYAVQGSATVFLTTHSSVALDVFGISKNAQIIHVRHDGESARTETATAHFDRLNVVSELGAKPSDLLQANGIIWVEGPSDRIYINRWIHLFSEGMWEEGRDYQCAFYGGALLARTQFVQPDNNPNSDLVNLLHVNPNVIVVCDSDRTEKSQPLKERVARIQEEVKKIPGGQTWILQPKEIENYLPGSILAKVFNQTNLPDPGENEIFFPRTRADDTNSYVEKNLQRKTLDKMDLALSTTQQMTKELMLGRFDLVTQISKVIERISAWNA